MDDLTQRLSASQQRLDLGLEPDRVERLQAGFQRRVVRRQQLRRVAVAAGSALSVLVLALSLRALLAGPNQADGALAGHNAPAVLDLPDGSRVTRLDELSIVRVDEASKARARLELVRGGARFDVTPNPTRPFSVLAGPVQVEVVGTEFTVERIGPKVRVSVLHGRVKVAWSGLAAHVAEGETGMFPRDEVEPAPAAARPVEAMPATPGDAAAVASESPGAAIPVWRQLANERKFLEARSALEQGGWNVPNNPTDLLLAADVARKSNEPAKAVPLLRRVVQNFSSDPRASAAAFTLGKTLMGMGSARDAAQAFARAGALDKGGAISEDALAREVEAWARAGDQARAGQRARDYVARYPAGLRLESVRRYGGL